MYFCVSFKSKEDAEKGCKDMKDIKVSSFEDYKKKGLKNKSKFLFDFLNR